MMRVDSKQKQDSTKSKGKLINYQMDKDFMKFGHEKIKDSEQKQFSQLI